MDNKVLINLKSTSGNISGVGYYTSNLFNVLKQLSGINLYGVVDLVDNEIVQDISQALDKKLFTFNKKVKKDFSIFKYNNFIENILTSYNFDIYIEPNNLFLLNKNKLGKIKIVTIIHDIFPIVYPSYTSFLYNKYFKFYLRKTITYSDKFIFVSKATRESFYCENSSNNIKKDSMIIYNDVSHLESKKVNKEDIRDDKYFLYIGNLEKRKGIDILLNVFDKYFSSNGNIKLIIAGTIRDKIIEKDIESLKERYPEKFKYIGRISESKKIELLKNCTAFIYPSRAEGFGIPPMEALLYGKPIILSNLKVFREVYGDIPIYFDLNKDAVDSLYNIVINFKYYENFQQDTFFEKYRMIRKSKEIQEFLTNF